MVDAIVQLRHLTFLRNVTAVLKCRAPAFDPKGYAHRYMRALTQSAASSSSCSVSQQALTMDPLTPGDSRAVARPSAAAGSLAAGPAAAAGRGS